MKRKTKTAAAFAAAIVCASLAGAAAKPITKYTPFNVILSRRELKPAAKNMLLGNEQMRWESPAIAQLTQKAWIADDMVYGFKALSAQGNAGETIYYEVYSEEERAADPAKEEAGLFCLHGDGDRTKPYILLFAGGGFSSVCTFTESLPVGAAFHEMGYTVFMGTYRLTHEFGSFQNPEILAEDISREIKYIGEHAEELGVDADNYIIGGFSAGSVTAMTWCDERYGYKFYDMTAPKAYLSIYGITEEMIPHTEVPTLIRFCEHDQYFSTDIAYEYKTSLEERGIPCDLKIVDCLHGFGLGSGTEAEGWPDEAAEFFKRIL